MEKLKKELLKQLEEPLSFSFTYWCNILCNPLYKFVWLLKNKNNKLEICSQVFYACILTLEHYLTKTKQLQLNIDYKFFIKKNEPIFKLINLKISIDPLQVLIKFTEKWDILQEIFRKQQQQTNNNNNWNNYLDLIGHKDKILCYFMSPLYHNCFEFYVFLFIFIGNKLLDEPNKNSKRYKYNLMLVTRFFNKVFNFFFQFPIYIRDRFTKCWLMKKNENQCKRRLEWMFKEIINISDFKNDARGFFITNGYDVSMIEHEKWKKKSKLISSYLWKILSFNVSLLIEQILKKMDSDLYDKTLVINIKGWCNHLWKSIINKIDDQQTIVFTYHESLMIIFIVIFWMKTKANLPNWAECFLILNIDSSKNKFRKNFFSDYPKIIDLSKNEWAICYKNNILKDNILNVIEEWIHIIQFEKNGLLPIDESELMFRTIKKLFYGEIENYYNDNDENINEMFLLPQIQNDEASINDNNNINELNLLQIVYNQSKNIK
jgi:hypothetical protein